MIAKNKRLLFIVLTVVALLMIPLIAMKFTNEVNWTPGDFLFGGTILLSAGLMCELVLRIVKPKKLRIILCSFILTALVFCWIEMAVGIF